MRVSVVAALAALVGSEAYKDSSSEEYHVAAEWHFEHGLDGWAQSSWEEMGAEIYLEGGELRGRIQQSDRVPRFDSPMLGLPVNDDYVVGMRIKYGSGRAKSAAVQVRMLDSSSTQEDVQRLPVSFGGGHGTIIHVPFEGSVRPDGKFHIIYAHLHEQLLGRIVQMRILPVTSGGTASDETIEAWSTFEIDWIKLIKKPTVEKVEGCINKYFEQAPVPLGVDVDLRTPDNEFLYRGGAEGGSNDIAGETLHSNADLHPLTRTTFQTSDPSRRFATTFNCPREGLGWRIRISGRNFGDYSRLDGPFQDWDTVWVDGEPCTNVVQLQVQQVLECTLPAASREDGRRLDRVDVRVVQPDHRGLGSEEPFLSYAVPAPQMPPPNVSNIGSHALDLSWDAPAHFWDAITVTGYRINVYRQRTDRYFQAAHDATIASDDYELVQGASMTVGNVTTTTISRLQPATLYKFSIQALVENQRDPSWARVDLYGRRSPISGALAGVESDQTPVTSTLGHDLLFGVFDANATLDHGPVDARSTRGPSRVTDGEGHHGLWVVGDAHVANCNTSSACCDRVDPISGACELVCSNLRSVDATYVNLESDRRVASNSPAASGTSSAIYIGPPLPEHGQADKLPRCGPALRLTGSSARQAGAAWSRRKMNVREGFDTRFAFSLSNPSLVCKTMDDVATHCRSRGADGLAFVLQNEDEFALGAAGMQLGYGGISNALVIEFDTFYNPETQDPYDNHVSVITRGWRKEASAEHRFELGGSAGPVDLTAGERVDVRILYTPHFDQNALFSDAFTVRSYTSYFMTGNDGDAQAQVGAAEFARDEFGNSLEESYLARDWENGMGLISVFVNDLNKPLFTTVLNLDRTLKLDSGRAWVGFTAATGDSFWQTHDVTEWTFESLRERNPYEK